MVKNGVGRLEEEALVNEAEGTKNTVDTRAEEANQCSLTRKMGISPTAGFMGITPGKVNKPAARMKFVQPNFLFLLLRSHVP